MERQKARRLNALDARPLSYIAYRAFLTRNQVYNYKPAERLAYQFPSLFGDLVYPYDRFHENVVRYTRLGDPDSAQEMHPFA